MVRNSYSNPHWSVHLEDHHILDISFEDYLKNDLYPHTFYTIPMKLSFQK